MKIINLNLNLLILVTLYSYHGMRAEFAYINEQEKIGSEHELIQNLVESSPKTKITSVISASDEKMDDIKVGELIVENSNENLDEDGIKSSAMYLLRTRAGGDVQLVELVDKLHCLSCFANGNTHKDKNCYNAKKISVIKCAEQESCYSELHPDYVRRGCKLKSLLNRTHVCKCPFCNDKPYDDTSYYDYKNIKDWRYDNERLQVPLIGIDLFCKVCETNGTNNTTNNICKIGKNSQFTMCERNQLCYMNADGKNDYVSRGCINRPIYNSIYFFCRSSLCNNKTLYHFRPKLKKPRILSFGSRAVYITALNIINYLIIFIVVDLCETDV